MFVVTLVLCLRTPHKLRANAESWPFCASTPCPCSLGEPVTGDCSVDRLKDSSGFRWSTDKATQSIGSHRKSPVLCPGNIKNTSVWCLDVGTPLPPLFSVLFNKVELMVDSSSPHCGPSIDNRGVAFLLLHVYTLLSAKSWFKENAQVRSGVGGE